MSLGRATVYRVLVAVLTLKVVQGQ